MESSGLSLAEQYEVEVVSNTVDKFNAVNAVTGKTIKNQMENVVSQNHGFEFLKIRVSYGTETVTKFYTHANRKTTFLDGTITSLNDLFRFWFSSVPHGLNQISKSLKGKSLKANEEKTTFGKLDPKLLQI